MKLLILATVVLAAATAIDYEEEERKYHQNQAEYFEKRLLPLNKRLALEANYYTRGHFIISPHNIWYNLASEIENNKELFSFLNFPDEYSLKQKFYSLALQMGYSGDHFIFSKSQAIAVDETVDVKKEWNVFKYKPAGMPDYLKSLKYAKPFGRVQAYVNPFQSDVTYSSHTVLLDHVMFDSIRGLAFPGSTVQRGPFYNEKGEGIATVEYLRMRNKFRVTYFPDKNIEVIEVPIGYNDDRSLLLAVGGKQEDMIEIVFSGHIFSDLKLTEEPIEVAFPRLSMSSAIQMGAIFDNMRRSNVFTSVRSASKLPELPISYYHIVTVNVTESWDGTSNLTESSNEKIDFTAFKKEDFIVNKPFLFALFVPLHQSTVKVPAFSGVYSYPGQRGEQKLFEEIFYFDYL